VSSALKGRSVAAGQQLSAPPAGPREQLTSGQ